MGLFSKKLLERLNWSKTLPEKLSENDKIQQKREGNIMEKKLERDSLIMAPGGVVEDWLDINDIEWFMGGSRKFGYDTPDSDVDYFICTEDPEVMMNLSHVGFCLPQMHMEKRYPAVSYSFEGLVHVCILREKHKFDNLHLEHDHLEKMFDENHSFRDIAKNMRLYLSGAEVYRVFIQSFPIKWP